MGERRQRTSLDTDETHQGFIGTVQRKYFEAGADAIETKYLRLQSG
jgi:methionine synthase I (cobalamin-dependent)